MSLDRSEDWIGRTASRKVRVTRELVDRFVALSGDHSPLHVSDDAARKLGFERRVAHGMLLGSLVSGVIGVELPGERGVIQDCRIAFRRPCYVDDEIEIRVEASEFFDSVQTLALKVKIVRADGTLLATGEVRSGIRNTNG